jgi:hypothetical protein
MKNDQMDDEAAQKKRGIASADKVGFFERIRMGNIDDPSSEAYKKLGAGRGRSIPEASKIPYTETDDAKNLDKAAMREKSEVTDERDAREAAVSSLPRKALPKTKKAPIVTKEQMKKAGFDNLRDYLNAQKGLKRRDNFASEDQKRLFATGARGTQTEGSAGEAEARANVKRIRAAEAAEAPQSRIAKERANEVPTVANRATDKTTPSERTGSQIMAKKQEDAEKVLNAARRQQFGRGQRDTDTVPSRPARGFSTPASREAWDKKYAENYTSSGKRKTEVAGLKKGGKVESTLMGKEGRGMAKATMQKVASKAVKGHEGRMHKMKSGGSVSKRADGIAIRGKTRGRMM